MTCNKLLTLSHTHRFMTLGQAAAYWRTKADVDALDGGLDRTNRRLAHDGLALDLLKLAISNPEVRTMPPPTLPPSLLVRLTL